MDKILLTVPEAAGRLSLSRSMLYLLMGAGKLRKVTVGRAVRISVEEVDRYARELQEDAYAEAGAAGR